MVVSWALVCSRHANIYWRRFFGEPWQWRCCHAVNDCDLYPHVYMCNRVYPNRSGLYPSGYIPSNISTLGVINREMGTAVLVRYLLGISISAVSFGLLLDYGLNRYGLNIIEQMAHARFLFPSWVGFTCTLIIVFMAIKPLRKMIIN